MITMVKKAYHKTEGKKWKPRLNSVTTVSMLYRYAIYIYSNAPVYIYHYIAAQSSHHKMFGHLKQ